MEQTKMFINGHEEQKFQAKTELFQILDNNNRNSQQSKEFLTDICETIKTNLEGPNSKLENKFNALILSEIFLEKKEKNFSLNYFVNIAFESIVKIAKQASPKQIDKTNLKDQLIHFAREVIRASAHMFPETFENKPSKYVKTYVQLKINNIIQFYKDYYKKEQINDLKNPSYHYFKYLVLQDHFLQNPFESQQLKQEHSNNSDLIQFSSCILQRQQNEISQSDSSFHEIESLPSQIYPPNSSQLVNNNNDQKELTEIIQFDDYDQIKTENEKLSFKLQALEINHKSSQQQLIQLNEDVIQKQQQIQNLKNHLNEGKITYKLLIQSQEEKIKKQENQIQQLLEQNKQLSNLNQELQLNSQQIIKFKAQILQLKKQNVQLEQQNQFEYLKQQYEINELKQEKQQYEQDQIKKLSNLTSTIQKQLNELSELQQQFSQQRDEKYKLEEKNNQLSNENSQLKLQMQDYNNDKKKYRKYIIDTDLSNSTFCKGLNSQQQISLNTFNSPIEVNYSQDSFNNNDQNYKEMQNFNLLNK